MNSRPPSKEERDFPLAYAVLAHNRFEQLLLMLSTFYETHNVFCISVPSNADRKFSRLLRGLADCFDNIHVIPVGKVTWASYGILSATYDCMEYLLQLPIQWRYFQYLSGVDVPLRTNMEMVRVLKQWNGVSHIHVARYPDYRLASNISKTNYCSGRVFWSSALGNPDMNPYSLSGSWFCWSLPSMARKKVYKQINEWLMCVWSARLASLFANAAFVAHKMYIEHQPAALLCMLKEIKRRRMHPDHQFNAVQYNHLPQIEFARGISSANLTRKDLLDALG